MQNAVLVINCGSSSIKYSIFNHNSEQPVISGLAERLGELEANISIRVNGKKDIKKIPNANHQIALTVLAELLESQQISIDQLTAIGHRVVHGGEKFSSSIIINDEILEAIEGCNHLAPLHNPANVLGIKTMIKLANNVPQIAVFDTAFHQTLAPEAFLYGISYELYEQHGIRRYGFHGSSYRFIAQQSAKILGKPLSDLSIIIAHLGNGCSAAAIRNGSSVDTTMGMTPLEGLIMGTRSGDIDPSLHQFLSHKLELDIDQVTDLLNKKSGLLGLSGLSNDMRTLEESAEQGNERAKLAIEVFCFRLARQIAGLAASLNSIDALVFTGGIGENSAFIRRSVISNLSIFKFNIDDHANNENGVKTNSRITTSDSTLSLVIPTNEEWMIASDSLELLQQKNS